VYAVKIVTLWREIQKNTMTENKRKNVGICREAKRIEPHTNSKTQKEIGYTEICGDRDKMKEERKYKNWSELASDREEKKYRERWRKIHSELQ
jgi:hypothetical protein